jgi:low affinity Fe/Cu permease
MARKHTHNQDRRADAHRATTHAHHQAATAWFSHFAQVVARLAGKPVTFLLAVLVVVIWAATGPLFDYSDTWQLVINTGTTIVTFLMVFLIQNTQNRDTLALQLKLSELMLTSKDIDDRFATIEDLTEDELEELHDDCRKRADHVLDSLNRRRAEAGNEAEKKKRPERKKAEAAS